MTVAILTHRRSDELRRAVDSVITTAVPPADGGWLLTEILVVDNNPDRSARSIVAELAEANPDHRIRYTHEPEPGIVPARNRALDEAEGDVLAFIDDDEIALGDWPNGLLETMNRTSAALVGGPVVTEFLEEPPDWVIDGGFFELTPQADGSTPTWLSTCNLAIDLGRVRSEGLRFDPRYPFGEDGTFSRLAASRGLPLRWSATATVKEYVEPERTTLAWRRERHRISTDAWVRAELDIDSSLRTQVGVLIRAGSRFLQGAATTVGGAAAGREATRNHGLALMSQARGGIQGWWAHRAERRPRT